MHAQSTDTLDASGVGAHVTSAALETDALNEIRGLVKPVNRALIAAELAGKIVEFPFREGERFTKGDILVRIDCGRYKAELNAAVAQARAARKTHANNVELVSLGGVGQLEVELSKAEVARSSANVNLFDQNIKRCETRAPYDGRVFATATHLHESVREGQELLVILDDRALEIEVIVPSLWLRWVKPGAGFKFAVDETGEDHAARVSRLGAAVDPQSQTVKLYGEFAAAPAGVLSGMSGTALFEVPQ